jgi:hypothetical protein
MNFFTVTHITTILAIAIAVLSTIIFAGSTGATSTIPTYPAAHYGASDWRVTQINGELIPAENAPMLLFRGGMVSVEWGCRFFWFDETAAPDTHLDYSIKLIDCAPISEKEIQLLAIFQNFYGFTPWGQDRIRVMSTGADILAADKIK